MLIKYPDQQQLSQLDVACNTDDAGLFSNIADNSHRGLPCISTQAEATDTPVVVVGGGPSLADTLESIRELKAKGAKIFALNNSAKYLDERGIRPDYQIVLDPREKTGAFVQEQHANEALLCSQVHPSLFDKCIEIGYPVRLWHAVIEGIENHTPTKDPLCIGGGLTVGLSGLCVVYTLGYRNMHLFGYDSSHSDKNSHAYAQPMNDFDEHVTVCVDSREFDCSVTMAAQAHAFQRVTEMLQEHGCNFQVYGDGLVPHMVKLWERLKAEKPLTAVYDLGVSPPTYDFFSFLTAADAHAKANGFTCIDVVFQPGPMHGFRHDQLPPDAIERQAMLERICIPGARLCPSVRNVIALKAREPIPESRPVFPVDWKEDAPVSHYGFGISLEGNRSLKAPEHSKRIIAREFPFKYATITLRQAEYWPERNSSLGGACGLAQWFISRGIVPVIVPDTNGRELLGYRNYVPASWDVQLRQALYEGAVLNVGVSNGCTSGLWVLSDVPYIVFKPIANGSNASTQQFFEAHNAFEKDWSPNGKVVWSDDKDMLPAVEAWFNELFKETSSCQA